MGFLLVKKKKKLPTTGIVGGKVEKGSMEKIQSMGTYRNNRELAWGYLNPMQENRKSFYKKAYVVVSTANTYVMARLYSYDTPIVDLFIENIHSPDYTGRKYTLRACDPLRENPEFVLSATTCRHALEFCGLNKNELRFLSTVNCINYSEAYVLSMKKWNYRHIGDMDCRLKQTIHAVDGIVAHSNYTRCIPTDYSFKWAVA